MIDLKAAMLTGAIAASALSPFASQARAADMDHIVQHRAEHARNCAGPVRNWSVEPGDDLEDVLSHWTREAGWDLDWHSEYSFAIRGHATFHGTFTQALGGLMSAMQEARPSPVADLHKNCALVVSDGLSAVR